MKSDFFIDYENQKQVRWWNKAGCLLVDVVKTEEVYGDKTGKRIGRFVWLKRDGALNKYVTNKMKNFLGIKESN